MRPTTRIVWGEFPPNADAIFARFPRVPLGAVFAYGNTIYVPGYAKGATELPDHLIVHEETHFDQQARQGGPAAWWHRYLTDDAFMLEQEVEAYRAQLASLPDRAERRRVLAYVVKHLASPMYGNVVTKERARRLLSYREAA